jgi:hypothetical protein
VRAGPKAVSDFQLPFFPAKKEQKKASSSSDRERSAGGVAESIDPSTTMQSSSMKRDISETHDTLRFGINAGVKADLATPHPLQSTIQSVRTRRSPPFVAFVRALEP